MRRILVVDDDPSFRILIKKFLELHGWTVSLCSFGTEAVRTLTVVAVDVILLDFELGPGLNGLDVLKQRPELNRDKRYVVLTGYGTQLRCREALLNGAADFLDKPVDMSLLLATLEEPIVGVLLAEGFCDRRQAMLPPLSAASQRVRAALRKPELRYSEHDLTIEAVAREVGVSAEHLCREFKRQLGRSALQHLHDIRVAQAVRLLSNTGQSVYAIARDCGYHTTSELDRHFHARMFCTPTAFRSAKARANEHIKNR